MHVGGVAIATIRFAQWLLALCLLGLAASSAYPQTLPLPDAPLNLHALGGGIYWVSGGISNTGFVVGSTGVIAIDAQMFVPATRRVMAQIADITLDPVNVVILTHSDPDHINGLPGYPAGAKVIAQEQVKAEMEGALDRPPPGITPPPAEVKAYLPSELVRSRKIDEIDGVRIELLHVAPAHTDGDLMIFLPRQRIVFAGDILTPAVGSYPVIHLEKRGSSAGWIRSVKAMLALDAAVFVSGHGAVLTREEVKARLAATEQRRAEIAALIRKGRTLDQIRAQFRDARAPGIAARFPTFIETTYQELAGGGSAPGALRGQ
jgi:glyoxylase-like metal-dependent hydrolase (beta-lactamase superfamily II)